MKKLFIKKIMGAVLACVMSATVLSGCAETIYEDNSVYIYKDSQNVFYEDKEHNFQLSANANWNIEKNNESGENSESSENNGIDYDAKFVYNNEDGRGNCWVSVRVDKVDTSVTDDELREDYIKHLQDGILKSYSATIYGREGYWLTVDSIVDEGIKIKNQEGEVLDVDEDNLVTDDPEQEKIDCIYFTENGFSYVFYYYAENKSSYEEHDSEVQNIIGSFKFN